MPSGAREANPFARLLRPFWMVCWASLAFAAFGLVPTQVPVYGEPTPATWFLGVVLQFCGFLVLAAAAWFRRSDSAARWLALGGAGLGTEVVYTAGAVALLTMSPDLQQYAFIAIFGVVCLGVLVQLERWGVETLRGHGGDSNAPTS